MPALTGVSATASLGMIVTAPWSTSYVRSQQAALQAITGRKRSIELNARVDVGHRLAEPTVAVGGIDSEILWRASEHVIPPSVKTALGL